MTDSIIRSEACKDRAAPGIVHVDVHVDENVHLNVDLNVHPNVDDRWPDADQTQPLS